MVMSKVSMVTLVLAVMVELHVLAAPVGKKCHNYCCLCLRYEPTWHCDQCQAENDQGVDKCEACGADSKYPIAPARDETRVTRQKNLIEVLRHTCGKVDRCATCRRPDAAKRPRNIAFLGRPGAGKSSLINSFAQPLGGEWFDYAPAAPRDEGMPKTMHITRYPKICMDMKEELSEKYQDNLLPTIIDVAGLDNENGVPMQRFLTLLLHGHIWNNAKTMNVYRNCEKLSVADLREEYKECYEDMRIDVVVFVASLTESLPKKLMKCVAEIAGSSHTHKTHRAVPLFGVLTKEDEKETLDDGQTVQEIEKDFKRTLGLDDNNYRFCSLFCNKLFPQGTRAVTGETRELKYNIAATLLSFMTRMCDPRVKVIEPDEPMHIPEIDTKEVAKEDEPVRKSAVPLLSPTVTDLLTSGLTALLVLGLLCVLPLDGPKEQELRRACDSNALTNVTDELLKSRLCSGTEWGLSYSRSKLMLAGIVLATMLFILQIRPHLLPR